MDTGMPGNALLLAQAVNMSLYSILSNVRADRYQSGVTGAVRVTVTSLLLFVLGGCHIVAALCSWGLPHRSCSLVLGGYPCHCHIVAVPCSWAEAPSVAYFHATFGLPLHFSLCAHHAQGNTIVVVCPCIAVTRCARPYSLSPGGLTNGYNGHVFWDSCTWMYPSMLLLHPDIANSILAYRYPSSGLRKHLVT